MRVLAWNVNHRTHPKPIPAAISSGILSLNPDVVVLTEYVEGPCHPALATTFRQAGMNAEFRTPFQKGHNQILVASRSPGSLGTLFKPPVRLGHAVSNCIHVRVSRGSLDLVGIRVPSYHSVADKRSYWEWFGKATTPLLPGRSVIIGDLNVDPRRSGHGSDCLVRLVAKGWRMPHPIGQWSYISTTGLTSRLDHALVSPAVTVVGAEYITTANGFDFAGRGPAYLSDHALLILDIAEPGQ